MQLGKGVPNEKGTILFMCNHNWLLLDFGHGPSGKLLSARAESNQDISQRFVRIRIRLCCWQGKKTFY
jgi:hypothetical protein